MKNITRVMIDMYKLKKIDFMGYVFTKNNATYHHLIIPKRHGGEESIRNGAVLNGLTSHPYLHAIENKDRDMFYAVTSEMIDENILGRLDKDSLKRIHDILSQFEKEHCSDRTKKGKRLIKEEYIKGRMMNCDNKKFF